MTAYRHGQDGPGRTGVNWGRGPDAGAPSWEHAGAVPAWSVDRSLAAELQILAGSDVALDAPPARRARLLRRQAREIRRLEVLSQAAGDVDACRRWTMAMAGHDLRQPLQVMALSLDRLRNHPDRAPFLATVMEAAVLQLTLGLDRLAHAAAVPPESVAPPAAAPVCLKALLGGLGRRWEPLAAAKGLRLSIQAAEGVVASDPILLGSALDNLVGNAVKYTETGGVLVTARPRRGAVRIEVADTGPGFDPSRFEALFEAYRQGDPSAEGLGLGLAIVAQVARLMGHRLDVRSKPGRGSCFAIEARRA